MKRREFIALVGSVTTGWPLIARAQQAPKLPTIGFLGSSTSSAMTAWIAAFVQRLHELGWMEGRTVAIEYRWGEGRDERYAQIADEFIRLKVNVIVTYGTPPTKAAKQATTTIPIVFAAAADPIGNGLVSSLSQPGGNVTGLSLQQSDIVGKKLELLRELLGGLRRLAVIGNVGNPATVLEIGELKTAADKLGIDIVSLAIRRGEDVSPAFDALKGRAEALYVSLPIR
jgi:putative ABC transport system substrate-binding protein